MRNALRLFIRIRIGFRLRSRIRIRIRLSSHIRIRIRWTSRSHTNRPRRRRVDVALIGVCVGCSLVEDAGGSTEDAHTEVAAHLLLVLVIVIVLCCACMSKSVSVLLITRALGLRVCTPRKRS